MNVTGCRGARRLALVLAVFGCSGSPEVGSFPDHWIDGTSATEPEFQVHRYGPGTWILRQSLRTHFEAPFIFLLQGEREALLLDTGATTASSLRRIVDGLVGDTPLIVAHTHAHGDHVAGDWQFLSRPNTHVVGHAPHEVAAYFGIDPWPGGSATRDLGRRVLTILPIPGHEPSSIALYDARTRLLLTGDTFYPGRLYVADGDAFRASIERLVRFAGAQRVAWVLGTHVEMTTTPGRDFPLGAATHPNERALELTPAHLTELQRSLASMTGDIVRAVHDDFIVFPVT